MMASTPAKSKILHSCQLRSSRLLQLCSGPPQHHAADDHSQYQQTDRLQALLGKLDHLSLPDQNRLTPRVNSRAATLSPVNVTNMTWAAS